MAQLHFPLLLALLLSIDHSLYSVSHASKSKQTKLASSHHAPDTVMGVRCFPSGPLSASSRTTGHDDVLLLRHF